MAGFHEVLANDLDEVARINERFGVFVGENGLPDKLRQQMALVFDEIVANIVLYGFEDEERHDIDVDVRLDPGVLTVKIEDDGVSFDPLARATPDVAASLEERDVGGLGIHLVRKLMDEVTYARQGDRNVLVLVKRVA